MTPDFIYIKEKRCFYLSTFFSLWLLFIQGCYKIADNITDEDPRISTRFIIERVNGGWPALRGVSISDSPTGDTAVAEVNGRYLYLIDLQKNGTIAKYLVNKFARWPALVTDRDGYHHIVYWNSREEAVSYASDSTGDWITKEIYKTTDRLIRPHIAVDNAGTVHIAFFDGSYFLGGATSEAFYSTNRDGEWSTSAIPISVDNFIQFTCEGGGTCYVLFYDINEQAVRVATLNGGTSWEVDTVDDREMTSNDPSQAVTVDRLGNIHIVYKNDDGFNYATKRDGVWYTEIIDSTYIRDPVIAIDSAQQIHIFYDGFYTGREFLIHMKKDGDVWESLEVPAKYLANLSLSVAPDDNIHIAFQGVIGDPMDKLGGLILEDASNDFESRLLDQGDRAGAFASMSVTNSGVVQIAHQNSLYENLRFSSHVLRSKPNGMSRVFSKQET